MKSFSRSRWSTKPFRGFKPIFMKTCRDSRELWASKAGGQVDEYFQLARLPKYLGIHDIQTRTTWNRYSRYLSIPEYRNSNTTLETEPVLANCSKQRHKMSVKDY